MNLTFLEKQGVVVLELFMHGGFSPQRERFPRFSSTRLQALTAILGGSL